MRRIDKFHKKLKLIQNDLYPEGVIPINEYIPGTAFFPGGDGLWKENNDQQDLKLGGVMVIGHNFDNLTGFKASLKNGKESINCPTWKNISSLLMQAEINLDNCFFTNFYAGVLDSPTNVGIFPKASEDFIKKCLELINFQIIEQRPQLILTLGRFVPQLIAPLSDDLAEWAKKGKLKDLDTANLQMRQHVKFQDHVVSAVIALTHPAQRHLNINRRTYKNFHGNAAELEMLKIAKSGLNY